MRSLPILGPLLLLALMLPACTSLYPDHCAVDDFSCARDPARARSAERDCPVAWSEAHPFQCPVTLSTGGDEFFVRWMIDHSAPAQDEQLSCEERWSEGETYPLMLMSHGGGSWQGYKSYSYLLEHLALNDFITVSVWTGGATELTNNTSPAQRAEIMAGFLSCLQSDDPANFVGPRWNGELALLGHSRGGEAVVQLAQSLPEVAPSVDLEAVVSLGPPIEQETAPLGSDDEPGCRDAALAGANTPAYLVINGSHEQDGGRGIAYYDRAGSEFDAEPGALTKSIVWVFRGYHNGYLDPAPLVDGQNVPIDPESLAPDVHRMLLKGYANGFLRWQLGGENYKPYFTGAARSAAVQQEADDAGNGPVRIYTRYAEGQGARRRVIDNAECPTGCDGDDERPCWQAASIGPGTLVTAEPASVLVGEMRLETLFQTPSPANYENNRTRALLVRWDELIPTDGEPVVPRLRFEVPPGTDPVGGYGDPARTPDGPLRDVRFFTHLVLDVGQLPDALLEDQFNLPPVNGDPGDPSSLAPLDFFVALTDEDGASERVRVSEVGSLTPATNPFVGEIAYPVGPFDVIRGHLQTVRIPLVAFCGVDLNRIQAVTLEFDADIDTVDDQRFYRGAAVVDGIAFVAEAGERDAVSSCPICGNGVVNDGEDCDDGNLDDADVCPNSCRLAEPPPPDEACPPGEPGCPCLESGANLPGGGLLGNNRFCNDDVTAGGSVRCVQDGPNFVCQGCTFNQGWGCPCGQGEDSCLGAGLDPPDIGEDLFCWGHTQAQTSFTGNCWDQPPVWYCDAHCELHGLNCIDPNQILCGP